MEVIQVVGFVYPYDFEIPILGHLLVPEKVFGAMEDFLKLQVFTGVEPFDGLVIDEQKGFRRHSRGAVPDYVEGWTREIDVLPSTRIVVLLKDWTHMVIEGEKFIILVVQIEQH